MASLTNYRGLQVVAPPPLGAGGLAIQDDLKALVEWGPKSVWNESADPTVNDDVGDEFYPGSFWLRTDVTPPRLFACRISAVAAVEWTQLKTQLSPIATKSAAYTLGVTDDIVLCDAAGWRGLRCGNLRREF